MANIYHRFESYDDHFPIKKPQILKGPLLKNPELLRIYGDPILALSVFKMNLTNQRRYAPLDRSKILGFPNPLPKFDWSKNLPLFKDEIGDDAALHLLKFHMHIRKFKVKFHEDFHMKIFMVTLEEKARSWYENLLASSICSLKQLHATFHDKYKERYSSLLLIQDYCDNFESFIQYLENYYDDDDDQFMDHEILEVL